MKYQDTCTIPKHCNHEIGWFGYIDTFWSKFSGTAGIRVFCCSDCGEFIQGKELKEFENKSKVNLLERRLIWKD